MYKYREEHVKNPFEEVTAEQLNSDLLAYLFAKPSKAVYNKLIGKENYRIIGGWGSGKTTLLKYISFEVQAEVLKNKLKKQMVKNDELRNKLRDEFMKMDFIGIYLKTGQSGFKPFLKPGGEFKEAGETLFGHYFNLLVLEKTLSIILRAKHEGFLNVSDEEEVNLSKRIFSKFSFVPEKLNTEIDESLKFTIDFLADLKNKVESFRKEIETYLNTRDLDKNLSYKDYLSVHPTSIRTFLNEVFQEIKNVIADLAQKRFYILIDECDLLSIGQQRVINTIIKPRFTTMVFKLASRPPDIKTMKTIEEGIGLTDREIKKLYLDEMYNPSFKSYRRLCFQVAKKRLKAYGYKNTDMRIILGKFTVEDEVGRDKIEDHLKKKYPNKRRIKEEFEKVYKDFKVAAAFQILQEKGKGKQYAGFNTFVMLSSGIMFQFLELCRETFLEAESEGYIIRDGDGKVTFTKIPLPIGIQNRAAHKVSETFFRDYIKTRAESLIETPIKFEFGDKIQSLVSALTGIFREKLMTFNEPEAARIEIPEGISSLDNSESNPIRQLFETAIKISVFQEGKPYMPKRFGGTRPKTYILNRILAPYPSMISPRPRWRTIISAETFNKFLKISPDDFKKEVLSKKRVKKMEKKQILPKGQLPLPLFDEISEKMPIISYLSKKIQNKPFDNKTLIILLHFLKDLIPFINACRKLGGNPSTTFIFYKNYQYPNKVKIERYLKEQGYNNIYPLTQLDIVLRELESKEVKDIIVVEDGGHIVPKLHRDFILLGNKTLGAVEQTTRGVLNDKEIDNLLFPIIPIPESHLKNTFEPPHVARAVISNLQKLLKDTNFSGRKALVIGFGKIGKEIALQLRDTLKMQVSVHDSDNTKLVEARQQGFDAEEELRDGVKGKFLIIGSTGETVIKRSEILAMDHNVYLVSASSEQWEFCISELDALSSQKEEIKSDREKIGTRYKMRNTERCINLIADGYPINFWKAESMPNEVGDLIMSLILISAVEIATNQSLPQKINFGIVDELEKRYELSKIYLEYYK